MWEYFNKVYQKGFEEFTKVLETKLEQEKKIFVITANTETFMIGKENAAVDEILRSDKSVIVPDGIGIVKAANGLNRPVKERVTGVELVQELFDMLDHTGRSLYLFGAKKEVLDRLIRRLKKEYSNINLVGACDGYVKDRDAVFDEIAELQPDVVLVALGIPAQEQLIYKHYDKFKKGIFIGVGGSFDVLSGSVKRAPAIFIKWNLEWLYRILREPKRIKRFYKSNVKFIFEVGKMRKMK